MKTDIHIGGCWISCERTFGKVIILFIEFGKTAMMLRIIHVVLEIIVVHVHTRRTVCINLHPSTQISTPRNIIDTSHKSEGGS